MPETGTSGSMSGDGKRSVGHRPQVTAPILDSTNNDQTGDPPRRSKRANRDTSHCRNPRESGTFWRSGKFETRLVDTRNSHNSRLDGSSA